MKKEITMWEYPYNIDTFKRNVKEYGLVSSLKHDLERTKENLDKGLSSIVSSVFYGALVAIAIPVAFYAIAKLTKAVINGEREVRKRRIFLGQENRLYNWGK